MKNNPARRVSEHAPSSVSPADANEENVVLSEEAILQQRIVDLESKADELQHQLLASEEALRHNRGVLDEVLASRSWRITEPLRKVAALIRFCIRPPKPEPVQPEVEPDLQPDVDASLEPAVEPVVEADIETGEPVAESAVEPEGEAAGEADGETDAESDGEAEPEPEPEPAVEAIIPPFAVPATPPYVVLFSGMEGTPGHIYRMERLAAALRVHYDVTLYSAKDLPLEPEELERAAVLWVWRAPITPELESLILAFKTTNRPVIFDIDDMCFHPAHFKARYMDVIRSENMDEEGLEACGWDMRMTMAHADLCVFTTEPLAQIAHTTSGKPCMVIPNSFDREFHQRMLTARRQALEHKEDDWVRIGYAAGTATHQADLQLATPALAAVLSRHPEARLVLFQGMVNLEELDALQPVSGQIEWRDPVPLPELPDEIARFDINIAPLEIGNLFCNCKSELKFFEAALAEIPSVLSATTPMRAAVRHGETGFLAETPEDWEPLLETLVNDKTLREHMGRNAYRNVLWAFGPENRSRLALFLMDSLFASPDARATSFASHCVQGRNLPLPVTLPDYEVDFSTGPMGSKVAVVIPLYNYSGYIEEALDSLLDQTLQAFDVIVVDDDSTDDSADVARRWLETHKSRFAAAALLHNRQNSRLSYTRNAGIDYSRSEYVMLLDADNILLPACLELCADALDTSTAAAAYPTLKSFGTQHGLISAANWDPLKFRYGNYVDAMAMLRKSHWAALGGYTRQDAGWEDYDFWCKMISYGFWGIHIPQVAALYRTHEASMLRSTTNLENTLANLSRTMNERYNWLNVQWPLPHNFPQL